MKRHVLLLPFLWAAAAAAQPHLQPPAPGAIPPGGLDLCEINCTCKPQQGTVNQCSRYWTFKSGPGGSIVRVVNPDPNACTASVDDNVTALSTHFGKAPELSLPTKEMADKAAAFKPPAQADLPYSRLLDAAAAVQPGDALDAQLTGQTARVRALAEDAGSFAAIGVSVSQWRAATAASTRLVGRVEGAEKALQLAKPWPKLREFAPRVWELRICEHSKPAVVAQLGSRITDESDIAWNFAFLEDWTIVQRSLDQAAGAAGAGTPNFDAIAKPFFSEASDRVKERTDKSLFTLIELRAFRSAVTTAGTAIGSYSQALDGKAQVRRSELVQAFDSELSAVARIREAYKAEQAAVATLKAAVEAAAAEKAKIQASIDATTAGIAAGSDSLVKRTAQRDQRRLARTAAQTELTSRRNTVDDALAKLQAIVLKCGGQSYEACNDNTAKKDYDKRRYEANKVVASARQALDKAQAALDRVVSDLLNDDNAILALRSDLASMKKQLGDLQVARETQDKTLTELGDKLLAAQSSLVKLTGLAATLDEAVAALDKVRPSAS